MDNNLDYEIQEMMACEEWVDETEFEGDYEPWDDYEEVGYNPFIGGYDWDC